MGTFTIVAAIAGLAFGLVGTVLSIINTKRTLDRDKVSLKVTPVWCFRMNGENLIHHLGIEIINLSYFPVTVAGVGFTLPDGMALSIMPQLSNGESLPQRMESRTSLTAYAPLGMEQNPQMKAVLHAFARTACGCIFTGVSPALTSAVKGIAPKS